MGTRDPVRYFGHAALFVIGVLVGVAVHPIVHAMLSAQFPAPLGLFLLTIALLLVAHFAIIILSPFLKEPSDEQRAEN